MEVASFIPLLETLKNAGSELEVQTWWNPFGVDLLEREPTEQHKLAAVVLVARVMRRFSRDLEREIAITRVGDLPREAPAPPEDWESRVSLVVLSQADAEPRPCTTCGGALSDCVSCDGSGQALLMRLREVHDVVATLRYAYVPSLPFSIEERVTKLLEPTADPPDCLRFDMAPRRAGSAYRDMIEVDPEFFGHSFADALAEARKAAEGFGADADVIRRDVRAYAWPLLLLKYSGVGLDRTVALVVRPGDLAHVAVVQ